MCTQTLSEGDRDETQREGGEDAHAAEMDRHYGEETHIPRKTDTSRHRDTCTPKDTLRDSHRETVKGGLSLKRQSHRHWQRCADESGRNTSKKRQRHEHSERRGEREREKHRYAQAEGESGQREIQFERQTDKEVSCQREKWKDGWMDGMDRYKRREISRGHPSVWRAR